MDEADLIKQTSSAKISLLVGYQLLRFLAICEIPEMIIDYYHVCSIKGIVRYIMDSSKF